MTISLRDLNIFMLYQHYHRGLKSDYCTNYYKEGDMAKRKVQNYFSVLLKISS